MFNVNHLIFLADKVKMSDLNTAIQFGEGVFNELQKGLSGYMPTLWNGVLTLLKDVMQPYGTAILVVLFFVEFLNIAKKISESGGAMTFEAIVPVLIKYLFLIAIIMNTHIVLKLIGDIAAEIVSKLGSTQTGSYAKYEEITGKGLIMKAIIAFLQLITYVLRVAAHYLLQIQVFMRFIGMYLMVPFAPLAFATLVSDEWRQIGIGYIKNFIAYAVQGVVLAIAIAFIPMLFSELAKMQNGSNGIALIVAGWFEVIGMILVFQKSQQIAKSIMGMG